MDPEEQAREKIDKMLEASGWVIQNYRDFDLSAGFGVAVREYPLSKDHSDYALFIDRNPVGVLEAKKVGWTLTGVERQSKGYLDTLVEKFPNAPIPPCFAYKQSMVVLVHLEIFPQVYLDILLIVSLHQSMSSQPSLLLVLQPDFYQ